MQPLTRKRTQSKAVWKEPYDAHVVNQRPLSNVRPPFFVSLGRITHLVSSGRRKKYKLRLFSVTKKLFPLKLLGPVYAVRMLHFWPNDMKRRNAKERSDRKNKQRECPSEKRGAFRATFRRTSLPPHRPTVSEDGHCPLPSLPTLPRERSKPRGCVGGQFVVVRGGDEKAAMRDGRALKRREPPSKHTWEEEPAAGAFPSLSCALYFSLFIFLSRRRRKRSYSILSGSLKAGDRQSKKKKKNEYTFKTAVSIQRRRPVMS